MKQLWKNGLLVFCVCSLVFLAGCAPKTEYERSQAYTSLSAAAATTSAQDAIEQEQLTDSVVSSQQEAAANADQGCFLSDGSPC